LSQGFIQVKQNFLIHQNDKNKLEWYYLRVEITSSKLHPASLFDNCGCIFFLLQEDNLQNFFSLLSYTPSWTTKRELYSGLLHQHNKRMKIRIYFPKIDWNFYWSELQMQKANTRMIRYRKTVQYEIVRILNPESLLRFLL